MEEAQRAQYAFKCIRFRTRIKVLGLDEVLIRPQQIRPDALGRLVRHLDAVLQYCYREVGGWGTCQEQPKVLVVARAVLAEPAWNGHRRETRLNEDVEGSTTLSDAIDAMPHIELASTCADSALETHHLQIVHP